MISSNISIPKNLDVKFDRLLKTELTKAQTDISNRLLLTAKNDHRFTSRSGRLISAIKIKGSLDKGLELYLDENIADYGRYVHDGQKSWKRDSFIEHSLKVNDAWIQQRLNLAVSNAVNRFNRL